MWPVVQFHIDSYYNLMNSPLSVPGVENLCRCDYYGWWIRESEALKVLGEAIK